MTTTLDRPRQESQVVREPKQHTVNHLIEQQGKEDGSGWLFNNIRPLTVCISQERL